MDTKYYMFFCYLTIIVSLGFYTFGLDETYRPRNVELRNYSLFTTKSPVSLRMYGLIEKYSKMYGVPKYVAYNVAYKETRYLGPFHWDYNPYQVSSVGAQGPMQILINTCNGVNKSNYTRSELNRNLELNVKTSMKLLNRLYKKYNDWSVVCGWYNTGRPIVNEYGRYCGSNLNYKSKWVKL